MRREKVWYVVINSHRMRILRTLPEPGEAAGPEIVLQAPAHHMRDVLRDRPARSFASAGGGRRSAVSPGSDPIREAERTFLRDVFRLIEEEHAAGAVEALVVIGSPEIIGLWREEIPSGLAPLVRREIVRNLVRLPSHALAAAIRDLLAESA